MRYVRLVGINVKVFRTKFTGLKHTKLLLGRLFTSQTRQRLNGNGDTSTLVVWPPNSKKTTLGNLCMRYLRIVTTTVSLALWEKTVIHSVHTPVMTTHLLSIERVDWPKLHDMFKARDAKAWQLKFPVGFPVTLCASSLCASRWSARAFFSAKNRTK